jgi:intracellular septation protein A
MRKNSQLIQRVRVGKLLRFLLLNFSTPIVFYLAFYRLGTKPAIAFAIAIACVQALFHVILKQRVSLFFVAATGFTVLFGGIDLFLQDPRVFKYAPAAENLAAGLTFLATLLMESPILVSLSFALPEELRPSFERRTPSYLRTLTGVWGAYFLVKAAVFYWLCRHENLGRLYVLRAVIGGVSGALLVGGEIVFRKLRRPRSRHLFSP